MACWAARRFTACAARTCRQSGCTNSESINRGQGGPATRECWSREDEIGRPSVSATVLWRPFRHPCDDSVPVLIGWGGRIYCGLCRAARRGKWKGGGTHGRLKIMSTADEENCGRLARCVGPWLPSCDTRFADSSKDILAREKMRWFPYMDVDGLCRSPRRHCL